MSEYKRPISLIDFEVAVRELSDEELSTILGKLHVSISRLVQSNELMQKLMDKEKKKSENLHLSEEIVLEDGQEAEEDADSDGDEFDTPTKEDIQIYIDSISENKLVIDNQKARCHIIENELELRHLPKSQPQMGQETGHRSTNDLMISTDNDQSFSWGGLCVSSYCLC